MRVMKLKEIIKFASLLILIFMSHISIGQGDQAEHKPQGLPIGSIVENFTAFDQNNRLFTLDSALQKGPVVLVFYRGQWCPYCNKHLSVIEDSLNLILETGAQLVAISPEKPEYLKRMEEKTLASYPLLYDEDYRIEESFDLLYTLEERLIKRYNTFLNAELDKAHSDDSGRLPVPATFIISQDYKVVWRQFDPDYKIRSSVAEIIENIPKKSAP